MKQKVYILKNKTYLCYIWKIILLEALKSFVKWKVLEN